MNNHLQKHGRLGRLGRWVGRFSRRAMIIVAVTVVLLVAARIALPFVLERLINKRLASMSGYTGRVADVDVYLFRGAYALDGVAVHRVAGQVRTPFFLGQRIDFSIAWRELWNRKVVSEIYAERVEFMFAKQREEVPTEDLEKEQRREWQDVITDIFPISITHLELRESYVRYTDMTTEPHVDLFIKDMHAIATGLRNRAGETGRIYPAQIAVKGHTIGEGAIELALEAEPLAAQPRFHLSVMIEDVHLPALNDSLRAIANVDVGKGTFNMAAEMTANDGSFEGYVKPFFVDVDYTSQGDSEQGVLDRIWENVVAGLSWLLKNKSRDELGTRIPFKGEFGDPNASLLQTIQNLFRHGFVRAFDPTIESTGDPGKSPVPTLERSKDKRD